MPFTGQVYTLNCLQHLLCGECGPWPLDKDIHTALSTVSSRGSWLQKLPSMLQCVPPQLQGSSRQWLLLPGHAGESLEAVGGCIAVSVAIGCGP